MKMIHFKSALISAGLTWVLGVGAFVTSYFIPIMEDPDLQANWVLSISIVAFAALGAHLYYRRGFQTHGLTLGMFFFAVAILLDAMLTVPLLIIPNGGNHLEFFTDPGFWLIGVEYVSVVAAYRQIQKSLNKVNGKQLENA